MNKQTTPKYHRINPKVNQSNQILKPFVDEIYWKVFKDPEYKRLLPHEKSPVLQKYLDANRQEALTLKSK